MALIALFEMKTQQQIDHEAVLRSIRLVQAQLNSSKKHFGHDPAKVAEIEDVEVMLDMILRRLAALAS
jgi:hypothetical protein